MSGATVQGTDYDVHIGFWTNWSKGSIRGATLTTTRDYGGLLIAFLAIYIGATGKSFWRLACIALHRYFSSSLELQDALHHQRQAIIRNAETPESAMWYFFLMAKAWRKKTVRPFRRLSLVLLLSIAILAAFSVAGVFSSRVTTETVSEVLLTGRNCRRPSIQDGMDGSDFHALFDMWVNKGNSALLNHAQKCYADEQNDQECRQYARPRIPFNVTRNASCPFDDELCKTGSIIVDTGLLNSNSDLGINMPPKSQFQIRVINQCAPLVSKGYTSIHNQTEFPDIPLLRLHYGNYTMGDGNVTDYLYQVPANLSSHYYEGFDFMLSNKASYDIGMVLVDSDTSGELRPKDTELIAGLQRPDADVALFFLSSPGVFYSQQVDDPWYSAHTEGLRAVAATGEKVLQFWKQDETVSVLGCTSQSQICNPNAANDTQKCQPLRGVYENILRFDDPWAGDSEEQKDLLSWISNITTSGLSPLGTIVGTAGENSLSARFNLGASIAGGLPENQWEQEVLWWAGAQATSLQNLYVEFANGPQGLPQNVSVSPHTKGGETICQNQRIMSTQYFSFSVLGVSLILIVGGIIVLLDLTLEFILDYFQQRNSKHDYGRLEWKSNAVLQLQRLAHESSGSGTWAKVTDEVPVTLPGQQLTALNVADREHPRLGQYVGNDLEKGSSVDLETKENEQHHVQVVEQEVDAEEEAADQRLAPNRVSRSSMSIYSNRWSRNSRTEWPIQGSAEYSGQYSGQTSTERDPVSPVDCPPYRA